MFIDKNSFKFEKSKFLLSLLILIGSIALFSRNIDKQDIFKDPNFGISGTFLFFSLYLFIGIIVVGGGQYGILKKFKLY